MVYLLKMIFIDLFPDFQEFAPCSDFLHMDITGTGGKYSDDSAPYLRSGLMTGRPTRTIIQFLYNLVCPQNEKNLE